MVALSQQLEEVSLVKETRSELSMYDELNNWCHLMREPVTQACLSAFELTKSKSKIKTHILLIEATWDKSSTKPINHYNVIKAALFKNSQVDILLPGIRKTLDESIAAEPEKQLETTHVRVVVLGSKGVNADGGFQVAMMPSYGQHQIRKAVLDEKWAGQYTYDTSGQSYFFFLTVLLLILIPFTYTILRGGSDKIASRVPYPCTGWNKKSDEVRKISPQRSGLTKSHIALAFGWVAFAFVIQKASVQVGEGLLYDPYKILGIAAGATEKEISRFYKKAAIKFHPDKVHLLGNQTKEEASNHFVELTKAYKALTDEDIRKNFELFGHPDGKQEFSQGIALPSWLVESKNVLWVMGAYALVLGILLPYLVGKWWYGTRKRTKDGVLNTTASTFFRGLKEETTFPQMLDILSAADEFVEDAGLKSARKAAGGKESKDEYARLVSLVRTKEGEAPGAGGWEGYKSWGEGRKRARVFIGAHLLRIKVVDQRLLKEKLLTIALALPLTTSLSSIALSYNYLSSTILILHLQQFLLQAVAPTSSPLLQLPGFEAAEVEEARKLGVQTVKEFGEAGAGVVEKVFKGAGEERMKEAWEVAKNWPVVEIVSAKFQVIGEKVVTPGSIVSFTVKMRINPPGQSAKSNEPITNGIVSSAEGDLVVGEEATIDELIGRRKEGEDGIQKTPLAHAPHFPKNRKPTWYIFIGDHKLNRVFVTPHKFTDMGDKAIRTVRMTFPAPPGPGLYTFQAYVMSDSFVGTDVQKDLRMKVEPPPADGSGLDSEDDISEPDEDTIAGQMALMKGMPVRRAGDSDDDDTSGTDDDEVDEDSSDSDSD